MSRVGQRDTGPEMVIRRALHRLGFRYRLHDKKLPGSPDLVFPRFNAVIFVHGCFWHSHGCKLSTIPATRQDFWSDKFEANKVRDQRNTDLLLSQGWRVLVVWQCAVKGKTEEEVAATVSRVKKWLHSAEECGAIPGAPGEKRI